MHRDALTLELESLRARTARLYAAVAEHGTVAPDVQARLADALDGLADAVQNLRGVRVNATAREGITWAIEDP